MKNIYVKNRNEWRKWLSENHVKEEKGIWLVFYKKVLANLHLSMKKQLKKLFVLDGLTVS